MSNYTIKSLKRIVENPYLNVAVGIIFLYSGISETVEEFRHSENVKFSAHHGVILFSILHSSNSDKNIFRICQLFTILRESKSLGLML